jgi:hypothetical protein
LETLTVQRWLLFLSVVPWLVTGVLGAPSIDETLAKLPPVQESYFSAEQLAAPGFHAKDGKGSLEIVQAADGEGAPLYRISITAKPPQLWESGIGWSTPKGVGPKENDVVLVSFEARCVDEAADAKGEVRVVLRRSVHPYNGALGENCSFGKQWKRFNLVASPDADIGEDGVLLTVNLGLKVQNIELRDVRMLNFGSEVSWPRFLNTVGASNWRSGRRSVGHALTPEILWDMMAFSELPDTPDFAPDGAWQATYTIFACHGYLLFGNKNLGILELSRTPGPDGTFTLHVQQKIRLDEAMLQVTEATVQCRNDVLGTPVSWQLTSRFENGAGEAIPDLDADEQHAPTDLVAGAATGDWCLFEAVQRLTAGAEVPEFSLLEGLSVVKGGQRLLDRGERTYSFDGKKVVLHQYDQIGHGVLPTGYWLDSRGRLQMVVTHSRAYILDPEAAGKFDSYSKSQIERYKRMAQRRKQEGE